MPSSHPRRSRPLVLALAGVRLAWGSLLVTRPERAAILFDSPDTTVARFVLRILGARHLGQAMSELWPHGGRHDLDPAIDAIHALTAASLAARDGRWRRPAATDALVASAFAGAGLRNRRVLGSSGVEVLRSPRP
ncbi:MAG: hypothetical protein M3Y91_01895 [Actinomycetota bacterium]|nr:hypothetical protein [Actinomycetota bacterium]